MPLLVPDGSFATVYVDASWSDRDSVGGWAFWAKSAFGKIVRSGRCSDQVSSSVEAELNAIWAAVFTVHSQWAVPGALVKSDCSAALDFARVTRLDSRPGIAFFQRKFLLLAQKTSFSLEFKWIRAHTGNEWGASSRINSLCDKLARKARMEQ